MTGAEWLNEWLAASEALRKQRWDEGIPPLPLDAAEQIHQAALSCLYTDRVRADALLSMAQQIAGWSGDLVWGAWSMRMAGHVRHVSGDYANAAAAYGEAATAFESAGNAKEVGRTLLSGLQALIYLGDYERAEAWSRRARAIFTELGDELRLARLESNTGNILYRQDRHQEAHACYERALAGFQRLGEPRDVATALSNLATCSVTLGEFSRAMEAYQAARDHCEKHGLANLTARADYNIAYLHYLRGDYRRAYEMYGISRELCRQTGDAYHDALCDLDEAEMSLELNLRREGLALARRAMQGFARQGLKYEEAKAAMYIATAASQAGDLRTAKEALRSARRLFAEEGNRLWPALVKQFRAVVAVQEGRLRQASRLGASAWKSLTRSTVPGRAAHCQMLLARLWVQRGEPGRAMELASAAMSYVRDAASPALRFHASLTIGEIEEARRQWRPAAEKYEAARVEIEQLRQRLDQEHLRISLLTDKLAVYEALASLCLDSPVGSELGGIRRAFALAQEAKSRSLAESLYEEAAAGDDVASERERQLRAELNWLYKTLESEARGGLDAQPARAKGLRARAVDIEQRLLEEHRRAFTARQGEGLADTAPVELPLRPGETLIEYFEIRGAIYAFVATGETVEAVRLGPAAAVNRVLKFVQFQLGKFRWADRRDLGKHRHLEPILDHFRTLYQVLLEPLESRLCGARHLILAPHRGLHELPFAALHDGNRALIERFSLSVIPSAAVFASNRKRARVPAAGGLVMGIPDQQAPHIEEEARLVHALLPNSTLLLGEEATVAAFADNAPGRAVVHLASHGIHRGDNPIFSALRLADARLSLFDLKDLRLDVGVVTLSACHTGAAVNVGGDELIGLTRGFLRAGVRSIVAALWDIDDESAREFMTTFYSQSGNVASALQHAMLEARARHPHPYYWAPFLVIGDPDSPLLPGKNSRDR